MKLALSITVIATAAVLAWLSPKLFLILAGVTGAAILVRYVQQERADMRPANKAAPNPVISKGRPRRTATVPGRHTEAGKVRQALDMGRRELGQDPSGELAAIEIQTQTGKLEVHVGYAGDVPFIGLRQGVGDDTEMAFVIRRRHSTLGLPRLVDNTPIATARFEYRLRTIPLPGDLGTAFDAGTNRPRLFRELLASGLADDLAEVLYHPTYRLEDLIYGGDSVTVATQPAADPTSAPWLRDAIEYSRPLTDRVRTFLDTVHIPSAQG